VPSLTEVTRQQSPDEIGMQKLHCWYCRYVDRAGLSKCGARLEALLRGPT